MPISKPHSSLGADNKGSCSNLATYLQKENEEIEKMIKNTSSIEQAFQLEGRKQSFFDALETDISTIDVIYSIDNNKKKLGANDAKYFAPTISFSENELKHIAFLATGKNNIMSIWELNLNELENFNRIVREYGRKVMDNYALNFNRQDKGINSGADLVYFGKIEHFRKFKGTDDEVINGGEKSGTYKQGLQSHIHIIVSRKDKTQKLKLSPTCNETNTKRFIGNNSYQVGFDRVKWIQTNEEIFDRHFNYSRKELEKFKNQNILKNGSPQEKFELNLYMKAIENSALNPIQDNQDETEVVQPKINVEQSQPNEKLGENKKELSSDSITTQHNISDYDDNTISDIDKKKKTIKIKF